jgi:hypothetical protein
MRLAKDTRQTLGLAIEALIELLDAIGPDPDAEPSLGNPEQMNQDAWSAGSRKDLEGEHDGAEPDVEDEPSLGALNGMNQQRAWAVTHGWSSMFVDGEPSLTVPEQVNQARAWAHPGNRRDLEEQCEDEGMDTDRESEEGPMTVLGWETQTQMVAANRQAREALCALMKRLRPSLKTRVSNGPA